MKLGDAQLDLDAIDRHILSLLQDNCRLPLAKIGEQVGLSAPAVTERVKKLEDCGVITGYHAVLNGRLLGMDITAFIGVSIGHPKAIASFEHAIGSVDGVLECHHVTGGHTLLLKVKTHDTSSLEDLIRKVRSIEGVVQTETMVVLSTHVERLQLSLDDAGSSGKRTRRNGADKSAPHLKGV